MTKFYFIYSDNNINTIFNNDNILFFSKKNTIWYEHQIKIAEKYNSYQIYEIEIEPELFTYSLNPKTKKVVKINKNNMNEYLLLKKEFLNNKFKDELKKRNIIGFDISNKELKNKDFDKPDCYIIEKNDKIRIK
jgi:hypothetical protein